MFVINNATNRLNESRASLAAKQRGVFGAWLDSWGWNHIKIAFHAQRIKCILLSVSYLNVFCVEKSFVWLKFIDTSNIEGSSDNVTVVN